MSKTILIVDDSLTVRMDLLEAFEAAEFQCLLCSTAAEAREALSRASIDLAVLDVILPDADGIDLLRQIRETPQSAGLPVMVLSTEAEVRDRIRGLRTGADEYIGKPYDASYVVSRARELLREREAAGGPRPTVLIIDDSLTFREQLRAAIESADYAVLMAASGEDGLRMAAAHHPAAILVDGVLPGVDGATVIRRIRLDTVLRRTPCVLLTASEEHSAELRAFEAGADAFVRKEEDVAEILARLAAVLRASPADGNVETRPSLLGPKKILAVDDSPTYLHELADALRAEGYDMVLAHSGEEALEMLGVQAVDCILLDLVMPGVGGKETCRRIKAAPMVREIPLIILTALENRASLIDGLATGADDYIQKSTEFEVLKARVRAQMRRKQFEDENRRIREELRQKEFEALEARSARQIAEARAAMVEALNRKNQELEAANKELEAFSYSVSHDLRAPLRGINAFASILCEEHSHQMSAEARNLLERVTNSAQRMEHLIQDLLHFSRLGREPLSKRPLDMNRLAHEVLEECRKAAGDRLVEVKVTHLPDCVGDPSLLRQVLINLVSNAFKFTRQKESAVIEIGCQEQGGEEIYFVRDNGAGFDMRFAEKLFGVFQRLHSTNEFEGTGVGLSIVDRIIQRHGGRVWVEAAVDQGATFYFTLSNPNLSVADSILETETATLSKRN